MRAGVTLILLLIACTGSKTPIIPPKPIASSSTEPAQPPAQRRNNSTEHRLCKASLHGFVPSSFWCGKSQKTADAPPVNVCYSDKTTCLTLRQEGIDSGAIMGACYQRDSAVCFTMVHSLKQSVHWRCYQSVDECRLRRQGYREEYPKMRFGECSIYEPRTVANR